MSPLNTCHLQLCAYEHVCSVGRSSWPEKAHSVIPLWWNDSWGEESVWGRGEENGWEPARARSWFCLCEDQLYGESAFETFNWAVWLEEMSPLTVIGGSELHLSSSVFCFFFSSICGFLTLASILSRVKAQHANTKIHKHNHVILRLYSSLSYVFCNTHAQELNNMQNLLLLLWCVTKPWEEWA